MVVVEGNGCKLKCVGVMDMCVGVEEVGVCSGHFLRGLGEMGELWTRSECNDRGVGVMAGV